MKAFVFILFIAIGSSSTDINTQLAKNWKLEAIEEFGTKGDLDKINIADELNLNTDGSYSMILFGKTKTGTWNFNAKTKLIHFKSETGNLYFKFFEVSDSSLVVEYQHPDLVRSKMHYLLK